MRIGSRFWFGPSGQRSWVALEFARRRWSEFGVGAEVSVEDGGGDGGLTFHLTIGIVAVWLSFPRLRVRHIPGREYPRKTGGELYRIMGDWVLTFSLHHPRDSWSRGTPWWRHSYVVLNDVLFGRWSSDCEEIVSCRGVFHDRQLDRDHPATYTVTHYAQRRSRFPIRRVFHRVAVELDDAVPVPGKGENSWDCGDDATYSISVGLGSDPVPDDYVGFANDRLRESVEGRRMRHGGPNWRPRETEAVS